MARLVEDLLVTWRQAERVLDDLPPVDPDHETVALAIDGLRRTYQELTLIRESSAETLRASRETLARARDLLAAVAARLTPPTTVAIPDPRDDASGA
jgi:hypothetical protein